MEPTGIKMTGSNEGNDLTQMRKLILRRRICSARHKNRLRLYQTSDNDDDRFIFSLCSSLKSVISLRFLVIILRDYSCGAALNYAAVRLTGHVAEEKKM